MTRKLKVAPDRQIVTDGKHYYGGQTFTVPDDHPDADSWIAAGYVSEVGRKAKKPQNKALDEAKKHYVAQARGLVAL